jgi:uncharacterized membrane protein YadS
VNRRAEAQAWYSFITQAILFVLGVAILVHQEFIVERQTVALIVTGVGCCGPAVAQSVATVFAAIRGGGGPSEPGNG